MIRIIEDLQIKNEGWKELPHRRLISTNGDTLYINGYFSSKHDKYIIRIYIYRNNGIKDIYREYIVPKKVTDDDSSYFNKLLQCTKINEVFDIIEEMKKDETIDIEETKIVHR